MKRLTKRYASHIAVVCDNCKEKGSHCNESACRDVMLNRLAEYEDMQEQGLLVRLPCKVGDSFFSVRKFCDEYGELEEPVEHWDSDCYGCNLPCNGKLKVVERKFNSIHHIIAEMESIGDSIFLTREEAEKALEDA